MTAPSDPRSLLAYAICTAVYPNGCVCKRTEKSPCEHMTDHASRIVAEIEQGRVSA